MHAPEHGSLVLCSGGRPTGYDRIANKSVNFWSLSDPEYCAVSAFAGTTDTPVCPGAARTPIFGQFGGGDTVLEPVFDEKLIIQPLVCVSKQ